MFGSKHSVATEEELQKAFRDRKDILIFVKETGTRDPALGKLLQDLSGKVVYKNFKRKEDLLNGIQTGIMTLLANGYEKSKSVKSPSAASTATRDLESWFEQKGKAYRCVSVYPTSLSSSIFRFTRELEHWVSGKLPPHIGLGPSIVRPRGLEFEGTNAYAVISDLGLICFGENVEDDGFNIERNTVFAGQVLKFALSVYSEIKFDGGLQVSFKVGKGKGLRLVGRPGAFSPAFEVFSLDRDYATVEREISTRYLSENINEVIVDLTEELWRWFQFSVDRDQVQRHVTKLSSYWARL
jgi:hypothetical protein